MTLATILKEKRINKENILSNNNLKNNKLPVWIVRLDSSLIDNVLIDALKILPANFIIAWNSIYWDFDNIVFSNNKIASSWFDFIISDDSETEILDYIKNWVVPIIWKSHHISSVLQEFDAWKVEWNAFIFENDALCDIYYATIRYLENYKFPYDNKALVKNVLSV